jgi:hypothetical protein
MDSISAHIVAQNSSGAKLCQNQKEIRHELLAFYRMLQFLAQGIFL